MPEVPKSMKMPRDRRQVYRGGILQIMVTRACDLACPNCTQNSNLDGKPVVMTPDQFDEAVASLEGYFGVLGVFGGNPTTSKYFDDYCRILRGRVPWVQRGLWSNNPLGKGKTCRVTFNPAFSNLNVHMNRSAYDEFSRDWPECVPHLKGLGEDSRHAPPWAAMIDMDRLPVFDADGRPSGAVENSPNNRLKLIGNCDINQHWSAMIGVFRGELRAYFCEIAGAMAMRHQDDPSWPDLGLEVEPGWWKKPAADFASQVDHYCHRCGIPLRGHGALAAGGGVEHVSATHAGVFGHKRKNAEVKVVSELIELGLPLRQITSYIENSRT